MLYSIRLPLVFRIRLRFSLSLHGTKPHLIHVETVRVHCKYLVSLHLRYIYTCGVYFTIVDLLTITVGTRMLSGLLYISLLQQALEYTEIELSYYFVIHVYVLAFFFTGISNLSPKTLPFVSDVFCYIHTAHHTT